MHINVNYGCGLSVAEGWQNLDASLTLRLSKLPLIGPWATRHTPFPAEVKFGDITAGLSYLTGSVDRVYCSHVLEHLAYEDCLKALAETYRILKTGKTFRGVMPDLRVEAERYIADNTANASHSFMRRTGLGQQSSLSGVKGILVSSFGKSEHLWLWDWNSIKVALESVGFRDVRRAELGDHNDAVFAAVEDSSRWQDSLGFSCIK